MGPMLNREMETALEKKVEEDLKTDEEEMHCAFCGKKVSEEDSFHCCNCYLCKDCEKAGAMRKIAPCNESTEI